MICQQCYFTELVYLFIKTFCVHLFYYNIVKTMLLQRNVTPKPPTGISPCISLGTLPPGHRYNLALRALTITILCLNSVTGKRRTTCMTSRSGQASHCFYTASINGKKSDTKVKFLPKFCDLVATVFSVCCG